VAVVIEVAALAGLLYVLVHRRVRRLTEAAARMAAGDLSARVGADGDPSRDGLTRLAQAFDQMAGTVEARNRELQDAETQYRLLVEEIPAATYVWSVDRGQTVFASPQMEEMLGYTVEEWLRTPNFWLSIVHPEDRERAAREARRDPRVGRRAADPGRHVEQLESGRGERKQRRERARSGEHAAARRERAGQAAQGRDGGEEVTEAERAQDEDRRRRSGGWR
jgi:PAS domain-containing protein